MYYYAKIRNCLGKQTSVYISKQCDKKKGDNMTDNEIKLINIIREHKHPEQALTVAIETTLNFLMQHQSSVKP